MLSQGDFLVLDMRFILTIIIFFCLHNISYSQSIDVIQKKLNEEFKNYIADPSFKEVFINRSTKTININDLIIPLDKVLFEYKEGQKIYQGIEIKGYLLIYCTTPHEKINNCIKNKEGYSESVSLGFKSKKGVYILIDLLYELQTTFNN